MSRVPYESRPQGGLEVAGGSVGCFPIAFPSRAIITKIVVSQTAGDPVNFAAALFNHEDACEGAAGSDSLGPLTGPLPADIHRVTPDLAGTAGTLVYFADTGGGHGFTFCNNDPVPEARAAKPRLIYLRITPQGSGPKEFAVAIGGEVYE